MDEEKVRRIIKEVCDNLSNMSEEERKKFLEECGFVFADDSKEDTDYKSPKKKEYPTR